MKTIENINNQIKTLKDRLDSVEGTPTEVYTRIVGYYRSIKNWNKGKRKEYNYRRPFAMPKNFPSHTIEESGTRLKEKNAV